MNDDITPSLRPGDRVVEQATLVFSIAAHLIGPEDHDALELPVLEQAGMPILPFADYRLKSRAALTFRDTNDEPCLQAADILAGCAMRFARTGLQTKGRKDPALRDAFACLLEVSDPIRATGVNMVMSDLLLDRLDIPRIPAAPFVSLASAPKS